MTNTTAHDAVADILDALSARMAKVTDAVRRRPQMYVGTLEAGLGLHVMVVAVAGCMAEVAGNTSAFPEVRVSLKGSDRVSIVHNGLGMDVETRDAMGRAQVERWMESFGPAVWFQHLCVANALSARLTLTTWWNGREYAMSYAEGEQLHPLRDMGGASPGAQGTRIDLTPSRAVFPTPRLSHGLMGKKLNDLNKLHPDVRFVLEDLRKASRTGAQSLDEVRKDEVA